MLKTHGQKTFWRKEDSEVVVSPRPNHIYHIHASRLIGRNSEEFDHGPYSFDELQGLSPRRDSYRRFRQTLSCLAYNGEHFDRPEYSAEANAGIRSRLRTLLDKIKLGFRVLFPELELITKVDDEAREVSVFPCRQDMEFVRPGDAAFGGSLLWPFHCLSEGEMDALYLLYQFLSTAYSRETNVLFLVDELDNHLHPALQKSFVQAVEGSLPNRAIILATTHSPSLIAAVAPEARILMVHSADQDKSGKLFENQLMVCNTKGRAARVLYELYGLQSQSAAMELLASLEATNIAQLLVYAQQCLTNSIPLKTAKQGDPQRASLGGTLIAKPAAKVLDIGAGFGRLIRALREGLTTSVQVTLDAVERDAQCREKLREMQRERSSLEVANIYRSLDEVPNSSHYDLVFLHNVIHEMGVEGLTGAIEVAIAKLNDRGSIHVLEQGVLPRGEQGSFVFDPHSLREVFVRLGFKANVDEMQSHGGTPLYAIMATVSSKPSSEELAALQGLLLNAVAKTIRGNVVAYAAVKAEDVPGVAAAFYACNIANGLSLLSKFGMEFPHRFVQDAADASS